MTALYVLLGGALGAPARYLLDRLIQSRHSRDWPIGTLAVNWIGSFLLGALTTESTFVVAFAGIGFLGAFTTWSTFVIESVRLSEEDGWFQGVTYALISIVGGILLAFLGHQLTA